VSTPITVAGTDILTIVRWARFLKYSHGAKRGSNLEISGKHGSVHTPDKLYREADILLEVGLPFGSNTAAYEALSTLAEIFSSVDLVTIGQTDPFKGALQAHVELVDEPVPTQNRFAYLFPLINPGVFWEDVTATSVASATPPVITTGGDRPIDDMVLTFAGPGYAEHTDALGQVNRVTIDAAAGAGTYIVDFGDRTVKKAGVDQDEHITFTDDFAMRWSPNAAQTFTTDVGVAADWRNKWA
jgi:hypothetical protein